MLLLSLVIEAQTTEQYRSIAFVLFLANFAAK
jgi:hypothetical protein